MHFTARFGVQEVVKTPPSELIGLRCLVADDNTNHRGAAVDILAGWGAQVSESDGPTSALDTILAADPPYDLVLVDGRMQTADDGLAPCRPNQRRTACPEGDRDADYRSLQGCRALP